MKASLRPASFRDVNYLMDIDLKSYDYPLLHGDWEAMLASPDLETIVACFEAAPIGFIVFSQDEIIRLAVKPAFRRQRHGTRLLQRALDAIRESGSEHLEIIVPEIHCLPGHPDDVSQFLMFNKFAAETPILTAYFNMYGKEVDGYRFVSMNWLKT